MPFTTTRKRGEKTEQLPIKNRDYITCTLLPISKKIEDSETRILERERKLTPLAFPSSSPELPLSPIDPLVAGEVPGSLGLKEENALAKSLSIVMISLVFLETYLFQYVLW